jgi:predicted ATPase/DNA-binding winged helix-turn-helix (wHTH) protein
LKQFGSFVLDTANECLWSGSTQIPLQPKPFAVIRYLVENPGRLIAHDELLDAIWPDTFVQPQVLRTYVLELRKVLGDDAGQPRYIQTLPKRGYCFISPVTEQSISARAAKAGCSEFGCILDRDAELAKLAGHLEGARAGQRQMIFVCGEVGIGKTALIDAFAQEAGASILIGRGQCIPGIGHEENYYPVTEALGQLSSASDGDTVCKILGRVAPEWLAAIGRESCGGVVIAASSSDRMSGSLCAALEEISRTKPILLIIEDLQWADNATLKFLAALTRRRASAQMMVVGTYRLRSVASDHPLKTMRQELLMQRLAEELVLPPLPKPVIVKLLSRDLGDGNLPAHVAAIVHHRAEGNPMFALAILRHLVAQNLLIRHGENGESRWAPSADFEEYAGVPDTLAQMVELELERLSERDQRLLEAGSLMPIAFPSWAVAAALEEDTGNIEDACEALARRCCFMQRAGSDELPDGTVSGFYAFTHGIYREVLYQRQSSTRRARWHVRVAERLGQLFAGRESIVGREMAMHYEAAGNWRLGTHALRSAARYASERGAHDEAAELLERALKIVGDRSDARDEVKAINEALAAEHRTGEKTLRRSKFDDFLTGI